MSPKELNELLDELLKELERLRLWADDLLSRMRKNIKYLESYDPADVERLDELLKNDELLATEYKRYMEESERAYKDGQRLLPPSRKGNGKNRPN